MRSPRDEHARTGHATGAPSAADAGARAFSDREVAIVPRGEPARPEGVWTRFEAEAAMRRRLCAPPGMTGRIMDAIRQSAGT